MPSFVGDRHHFAIEYEITQRNKDVMGRMRVWIEGKTFGAFEDVNILSTLHHQFEGWEARDNDGEDFAGTPTDEVFRLITSGAVPDARKYLFSPGEAFDDFLIFSYTCGGKLCFVWKLEDAPFFDYPGYPTGVQSAQVSIDDFRTVVAKFGEAIAR